MTERPTEQATMLTVQDVRRAIRRLHNEVPDHRHVFHPNALVKDGWYSCAGLCGETLPIRGGLIDWTLP